MATQVIIGKVGITPQGEWSASRADYNRLDWVTYQGSSYMVIWKNGNVPVGIPVSNTTYFEETAKGVDLSALQYKGSFDSIALALTGIPLSERKLGDYVTIKTLGVATDYWWKNGITDIDLILKSDFLQKEISTSRNLFNKAKPVYPDQYITTIGTLDPSTGTLNGKIDLLGRDIDVLSVSGLVGVGVTGQHNYRFTDATGLYVNATAASFQANTKENIVIPSNARFFEFSYKRPTDPSTAGDAVMVNYGVTLLPYEAFSLPETNVVKINDTPISASQLQDDAKILIAGNELTSVVNRETLNASLADYAPLSDLPNIEIEETTTQFQLFDKTVTVYPDQQITSAGGLSASVGAKNGKVTIDATKGVFSISGIVGVGVTGQHNYRFTDVNGVFIAGQSGTFAASSLLNKAIPATAKYFEFTFLKSGDPSTAGDAVMVNYGEIALAYQSYAPIVYVNRVKTINNAIVGEVAKDDLLKYSLLRFLGKKLVTLGDSLTAQKMWQQLLSDLTGMAWSSDETSPGLLINGKLRPMGIGGSRIVPEVKTVATAGQNTEQSIYYRADFVKNYNPDVIILMGSQNDGFKAPYDINEFAYDGPEFSETSTGKPSFTACYKGVLEKLITQNPKAKIIAMTPMYYGSVPLSAPTLEQYRLRNEAIKAMCAMYSIQCIDLLNEVGIHPLNSTTYYSDDIHFNALGGEKAARLISSKL